MKVAQHAERIIEIQDGEIFADSGSAATAAKTRFTPAPRKRQSRFRGLLDRLRESLRMALNAMNAHRLHRTDYDRHYLWHCRRRHRGGAGRAREKRWRAFPDWVPMWFLSMPGAIMSRTMRIRYKPGDGRCRCDCAPAVCRRRQSGNHRHAAHSLLANASKTSVSGVGVDYFRIQGIKLVEGSNFSDEARARKSSLISTRAISCLANRARARLAK